MAFSTSYQVGGGVFFFFFLTPDLIPGEVYKKGVLQVLLQVLQVLLQVLQVLRVLQVLQVLQAHRCSSSLAQQLMQ